MENKDFLNGWREENGIKGAKHYAGGCDYDPTAEAIRQYMMAEERKKAEIANAEVENAEADSAEIESTDDLTQ